MSTINNTSNLFEGGRRRINETYYDLLSVKKVPTVTVNGSVIDFDNGWLNINDSHFEFTAGETALDLAFLGSLISEGTYLMSAVPAYDEPRDANEAMSMGLNYYIYDDFRRQSFARPFINPAAIAEIERLGGYVNVSQAVYQGCATAEQTQAFNNYEASRLKVVDPRSMIKTLKPSGFKYVLAKIAPQNNFSKVNALLSKTECELKMLLARIGDTYSDRMVMTTTNAVSDYQDTEKLYLIKRAFVYSSEADAQNNVNGVELQRPFDFSTVSEPYVALYIYSYPSDIPVGQEGDFPKIERTLTRANSEYLGRINPIYLENLAPNANVSTGPSNRLTHYGDPCALLEFEVDNSNNVTVTKEIFDSYVK